VLIAGLTEKARALLMNVQLFKLLSDFVVSNTNTGNFVNL
jgi:hypothetical protein